MRDTVVMTVLLLGLLTAGCGGEGSPPTKADLDAEAAREAEFQGAQSNLLGPAPTLAPENAMETGNEAFPANLMNAADPVPSVANTALP